MKTILLVLAVASSLLFGSSDALAQYNLRTVPSTPQAGAPFVVAFDGTSCEIWTLEPPGAPPSVGVQASTVRVAADLATVSPCIVDAVVNTVGVPALPEGTYQLELVARALGAPGNENTVQVVSFQVGPAVNLAPFTIPATGAPAHWLLALLMMLAFIVDNRSRR